MKKLVVVALLLSVVAGVGAKEKKSKKNKKAEVEAVVVN